MLNLLVSIQRGTEVTAERHVFLSCAAFEPLPTDEWRKDGVLSVYVCLRVRLSGYLWLAASIYLSVCLLVSVWFFSLPVSVRALPCLSTCLRLSVCLAGRLPVCPPAGAPYLTTCNQNKSILQRKADKPSELYRPNPTPAIAVYHHHSEQCLHLSM